MKYELQFILCDGWICVFESSFEWFRLKGVFYFRVAEISIYSYDEFRICDFIYFSKKIMFYLIFFSDVYYVNMALFYKE